jgi:DNA-directed RNA polymerase specialized sigma24 family protein
VARHSARRAGHLIIDCNRRATFDEVAALSVEGLNQSAIARAKRISWNTVHRWLERAAGCCRRFSAGFDEQNVVAFLIMNTRRQFLAATAGGLRVLLSSTWAIQFQLACVV